jgi:hypothetical protein
MFAFYVIILIAAEIILTTACGNVPSKIATRGEPSGAIGALECSG